MCKILVLGLLTMKTNTNTETYDKILWECFKLFLQKGYKEVTIPDIEEAIGMTRGAVFYYLKDKKELFKAVIDRYVLERQNINNKIKQDEEPGLLRFIIKYIEGINRTQQSFQPLPEDKGVLFSYHNLTNSALTYYDGFKEKAIKTLGLETSLWEKVIESAKKTGEIKDNTNVIITAKMFQCLFFGYSYISGIKTNFDSSELLEVYINAYNQIKS